MASGKEIDGKALLNAFVFYLETNGNAAETARQSGVAVSTVRKYRRLHGWDGALDRVTRLIYENAEAAHTVSIDESVAKVKALRDAMYNQLFTSPGKMKKDVSASMIERYRDLDRYVLELTGHLPGKANPETLPESKIRQLVSKMETLFLEVLDDIPGATTWIKAHPESFERKIAGLVEQL